MRRRCFRAGWLNQVFTRNCHFFLKCWLGMTLLCFTILAGYRLCMADSISGRRAGRQGLAQGLAAAHLVATGGRKEGRSEALAARWAASGHKHRHACKPSSSLLFHAWETNSIVYS